MLVDLCPDCISRWDALDADNDHVLALFDGAEELVQEFEPCGDCARREIRDMREVL